MSFDFTRSLNQRWLTAGSAAVLFLVAATNITAAVILARNIRLQLGNLCAKMRILYYGYIYSE